MAITIASLTHVTDAQLLSAVTRAAAEFCTQILHLSEHAAYGRIEAARCARRFPMILDLLAEGAVTLTTIGCSGRISRRTTPTSS
jgi:hypothetical protein